MELYQKTVFLLDHGSLMREPGGVPIEIDTGAGSSSSSKSKSRGGYMPFSFIPSVTKKLWTHVVENSLEYGRIVFDLFSDTRPLRFVLNDPASSYNINSWNPTEQTFTFLNEAFAEAGPPHDSPSSIQTGFKIALQALSQPTKAQRQQMRKTNQRVKNRGRIICITSVLTDEGLEDIFEKVLSQHNESVLASDHLLPVDSCEFGIISVHAEGKENLARIISHPLQEVSALLSTQVIILTPANMNEQFVNLCVTHHDLVSLTVTGIPMKEEQKAQASSNYDVPLFHPRMSSTSYDSQVLKWSTPSAKPSSEGNCHHCNSVVRITPVDVYSRPSVCLSNFVIAGRSVTLESPKKNKVASHNHVLTPHGGEMWMHSIETTRNILEDPPSISEGMGGRVTDYRIPDLVNFMKQNKLVPYHKGLLQKLKADGVGKECGFKLNDEFLTKPKDWMKQRLLRKTVYWPLTIGGSILFSMTAHLDNLLQLLPLDVLTDSDKADCDKNLWALMAIEARGDPPPVPSPIYKKGHKRDEQWRMLYTEVENFIRGNLHSENHKKFLECFLASRQREDNSADPNSTGTGSGTPTKGSKNKTVDDLKASLKNSTNTSYPRSPHSVSMTDSPLSPDDISSGSGSGRTNPNGNSYSASNSAFQFNSTNTNTESRKPSLASLWSLKNTKKDLRALPTDYKLYQHLKLDQDKSEKIHSNKKESNSKKESKKDSKKDL